MDTINCWLYSIPDTVYAAALASIITLAGVMASNRGANKRLIKQLSIEAEERSRERELFLRKEVYLKAAEEMTRAQYFLGELSKGNVGNINVQTTLGGFFASASKIHIVGTDETIKAVTKVTNQFGLSMFRLLALSMPLDKLKTDINILNKGIDDHSAKRERFLNEMTDFNLRRENDGNRWRVLQENFEFVHGEIQKYVDERSDKWNQHNSYQRTFVIECTKESMEIAKLLIPAVVSIRKELNLPFDADGYKTMMYGYMEQMEFRLREFMNGLRDTESA